MTFDFPLTFMEKVDIIIEKNLNNENFKPTLLSKNLALSYSQVYRKIKRYSGLTPSRYIRKTRLEKAHQLIKYTDLLIKDIANLVGFNSLSYFSQCFSNHFHVTPYHFKQKYREINKVITPTNTEKLLTNLATNY